MKISLVPFTECSGIEKAQNSKTNNSISRVDYYFTQEVTYYFEKEKYSINEKEGQIWRSKETLVDFDIIDMFCRKHLEENLRESKKSLPNQNSPL